MERWRRGVSLIIMVSVAGCATVSPNAVAVADPVPDADPACYAEARVPFYRSANTALLVDKQQEATRQNGQTLAVVGVVATLASLGLRGAGGDVVRGLGAAATVAGVLASTASTDQRIIADVSYRFSGLVACRQAEARQVHLDQRARRINAAGARERLRGLRDLMVEDAELARQVNASLARRNQVYLLAYSKIDTQVASDPVERQKAVQARQTIQTSQRALTDQASMIDKAAQTITVSAIEPAFRPV